MPGIREQEEETDNGLGTRPGVYRGEVNGKK